LEGLPSKLLRNKAFVNSTIQAQRCDSSEANQKGWSLSASGQIMFTPPKSATERSSRCADLSVCDTAKGKGRMPISMKPCNDEKNQQFKYVMKHDPTPPPTPPAWLPCVDAVSENSKATLGCPAGQTIASVDFASFGMWSDNISRRLERPNGCVYDFQLIYTLSNAFLRFSDRLVRRQQSRGKPRMQFQP
jgi:hypothetical protein